MNKEPNIHTHPVTNFGIQSAGSSACAFINTIWFLQVEGDDRAETTHHFSIIILKEMTLWSYEWDLTQQLHIYLAENSGGEFAYHSLKHWGIIV